MAHEVFRSAECHPDQPYLARGLCGPCYYRLWRAENPGKNAASSLRWRQAHPEDWKRINRANNYRWRQAHPEAVAAIRRRYRTRKTAGLV